MSRTRLIRPAFFSDELVAQTALSTRLFYIGLWTLCDDAGYFEWKPRQIAATLFPYEGAARRGRLVESGFRELVDAERVQQLPCGLHGVVPTLPKHGAKGGNKAETYAAEHRRICLVRTSSEQVRTSPLRDRDRGKDRDGVDSGMDGGAPRHVEKSTTESEFAKRVPRPRLKAIPA